MGRIWLRVITSNSATNLGTTYFGYGSSRIHVAHRNFRMRRWGLGHRVIGSSGHHFDPWPIPEFRNLLTLIWIRAEGETWRKLSRRERSSYFPQLPFGAKLIAEAKNIGFAVDVPYEQSIVKTRPKVSMDWSHNVKGSWRCSLTPLWGFGKWNLFCKQSYAVQFLLSPTLCEQVCEFSDVWPWLTTINHS